VTLNVLDELKRLPGTTNVQIFGAKDYAMRIWVKPDRLAQLKLTPGDVARPSTSRTRSSPPARSARRRSAQAGPGLHGHHRGGSRTRRNSARSSCAPIPTARRCALRRRARGAGREGLRFHRPLQRPRGDAGRHLPGAGANALQVAKTVHTRARSWRRGFRKVSPTPFPTTPRTSSRSRSRKS